MQDRAISLNAVIKAVDKHTNDDGTLDDDISCILEDVPPAEPFKGMTNGEVIKTVFDVDEIQVTENTVIVRVKGSFCAKMQFLLDWWTAKYEGEQNE